MNRRFCRLFSVLAALVGAAASMPGVRAQDDEMLLDLRGRWKFELGDGMERAKPEFNDAQWSEIVVPAYWEDEGYPGYDGYAWYRKHFTIPAGWRGRDVFLRLGKVDDVDEVYMNGVFIGFYGTFPPKYISAYNVSRKYPIPAEVLHSSGDNVIAVRVFDNELGGGIARGPVGIFVGKEGFRPDVPFPSAWKFSPEDDDQWKNPGFNDDSWVSVRVPGWWETQGFKGHDGFAWYRVRFRVPPSLASQSLILLVGKIDDYDETFLNGQKVGRTGPMPVGAKAPPLTKDYSLVRAYPIPAGSLLTDSDNVLAVRVYDVFMHGGIYEGPIGLVTREHYLAGKNVKGVNRPWWSKFWEYFIR